MPDRRSADCIRWAGEVQRFDPLPRALATIELMNLFSPDQLDELSDQALSESINLQFRLCRAKQNAVIDANMVLMEMLAERRSRVKTQDSELESYDQSYTSRDNSS